MSDKTGFVYIWLDRKHKRYYIGSHWGYPDDGYVCSSTWMMQAYRIRPQDFKRRIIKSGYTVRTEMLDEERRFLEMIKPHEIKVRYYNIKPTAKYMWHTTGENSKTIGEKISAAKMGKSPKWVDPAERGRKISEGKKAAFEKRFAETGSKLTPEHHAKVGLHNIGRKHTQEWKDANSARLKEQWATGIRS